MTSPNYSGLWGQALTKAEHDKLVAEADAIPKEKGYARVKTAVHIHIKKTRDGRKGHEALVKPNKQHTLYTSPSYQRIIDAHDDAVRWCEANGYKLAAGAE